MTMPKTKKKKPKMNRSNQNVQYVLIMHFESKVFWASNLIELNGFLFWLHSFRFVVAVKKGCAIDRSINRSTAILRTMNVNNVSTLLMSNTIVECVCVYILIALFKWAVAHSRQNLCILSLLQWNRIALYHYRKFKRQKWSYFLFLSIRKIKCNINENDDKTFNDLRLRWWTFLFR